MTNTIQDVFATEPKEKNGEINNTQKRKIGAEKLQAIEYQENYTDEQKAEMRKLATAFKKFHIKSVAQLRLYSEDVNDLVANLENLANAIIVNAENETLEDVLKHKFQA